MEENTEKIISKYYDPNYKIYDYKDNIIKTKKDINERIAERIAADDALDEILHRNSNTTNFWQEDWQGSGGDWLNNGGVNYPRLKHSGLSGRGHQTIGRLTHGLPDRSIFPITRKYKRNGKFIFISPTLANVNGGVEVCI